MPKYDWYDAEIVNILDETPTVKRFFLQVPALDRYKFEAGQYVRLELPIPDVKKHRHYSISSAPNGSNVFELLIVLEPKGKATNYLFNEVNPGSKIKVTNATGRFLLPPVLDKEICFIATGVGLAPLRSMYLNILKHEVPHKDIHVVFGTRYEKDIVLRKEAEELQERYPEFHYHPVLSREDDPNWKGHKGYVHKVYQEIYEDKRPAYFMICGWKNMVQEARKNLLDAGYPRSDIYFERFD